MLVGHRAAVNVVDFDDKYIVSASGDRTIKVHFLLILCNLYFVFNFNLLKNLSLFDIFSPTNSTVLDKLDFLNLSDKLGFVIF